MEPLIADETFKLLLDRALKKQNISKKERDKIVDNYLLKEDIDRNTILDMEEQKARLVGRVDSVPSEDAEQIRFVEWFRSTYPGVDLFYVHNGGSRTVGEREKCRAMGTLPGVSDLISLKWRLCIEMKRIAGGVQSKEQRAWADYCQSIGFHYILAFGCDNGIEKVKNFVDNLGE